MTPKEKDERNAWDEWAEQQRQVEDAEARELAYGIVGCGTTILAYLGLQILCSAGIAWALNQGFPRIGFWQAFSILLVLGWLLVSLKLNQMANKSRKTPKDTK